MPAYALVVAVGHTEIAAFPDRPSLVLGAQEFAEWLVSDAGGGLEQDNVWMSCVSEAGVEYTPPGSLSRVQRVGPPTVASLTKAAEQIGEKMYQQGRGELIVYWAGHGTVDGEWQLVPIDTLATAGSSRVWLDGLLIRLKRLVEPDKTIAIIDACRAYVGGRAGELGPLVSLVEHAESRAFPRQTALYYACAEGARAYSGMDTDGGNFTAVAVKALRERRDEPDAGDWLSPRELVWLRDRLRHLTRLLGQRPHNRMQGLDGDVVHASSPVFAHPAFTDAQGWDEIVRKAEACGGEIKRHILQQLYYEILPAGVSEIFGGSLTLADYIVRIGQFQDLDRKHPPQVLSYLFTLANTVERTGNFAILTRWLQEDMNWWNWTDKLRSQFEDRQDNHEHLNGDGCYLVAEIKPPVVAPDTPQPRGRKTGDMRYEFRVGLYRGERLWWPLRFDGTLRTLDSIEKKFMEILDGIVASGIVHVEGAPGGAESEEVLLNDGELEHLTVEFVVPRDLLFHGFGSWRLAARYEIGAQYAVVLRDGNRRWNTDLSSRQARRFMVQHRQGLRKAGGELGAIHTQWVTCENSDSTKFDPHVPAGPYVAFGFPAYVENSKGKRKATAAFETILNMGAVAVLWPDTRCGVMHSPGDLATLPGNCGSVTVRREYDAALQRPGRNLKPRFFVRDSRKNPDHTPKGLNLLYDDGTRDLEGKFRDHPSS